MVDAGRLGDVEGPEDGGLGACGFGALGDPPGGAGEACVVATLWFGTIGYIDDYLIVVRRRPKGLVGRYKLLGQVVAGLAIGLTDRRVFDDTIQEETVGLRPGDTRASCNTSDLARAIDAAVADGVDIINYSVGNSEATVTAPDDIALLAAIYASQPTLDVDFFARPVHTAIVEYIPT